MHTLFVHFSGFGTAKIIEIGKFKLTLECVKFTKAPNTRAVTTARPS